MAGKAIKRESFKKNVVRDMKALNTYQPEFEPVIGIYCEIYEQYQRLTKIYIDSGLSDANTAKRLESLRKDFISYSDRLGLNPKAIKDIKPQQGKKAGLVHKLHLAEVDTG